MPFATLVAAVEEGRVVYRNLKKILLYLLSTSVDEVVILIAALLAGYPPPLAAVQILWINLVTEGVVTIHLVMDPAEGDEMSRPPVSAREPLLSRALLARMAFMTPSIVASTLGWSSGSRRGSPSRRCRRRPSVSSRSVSGSTS